MIGGFFGHMSAGLAAGTARAVGAINSAAVAVRTATAAVIGGTISWLAGGKFGNGATTMAFIQLFKEVPAIYKRVVGYRLDARPGGPAVEKGVMGRPVKLANNIGTQDTWEYDKKTGQRIIGRLEEGGSLSRFANQIPGVNAVAGMHDVFQVSMGNGLLRGVLNIPGMFVAAGITYAGFSGYALNNSPNYSTYIMGRSTYGF